MNRIFRIIWSQAMNAWVVVSELATSRGKRSGGTDVDERVAPTALVLDRDMVEGSPPAAAWPLRMGILLALLTLYAPAEAANRYWDANGTAVERGGSGSWGGLFWSASPDGVSGPYSAWDNAALDDAFFGGIGTANTVTLGGPFTVHNMTFETTGYTITGNTLTLGGVTPTITTTGNATINSILAGTVGLTKAGAGTLTLNGANTFSGGINVTTGTLAVNGDAALGAASNGVTMAGGTGLSATGALASTRNITLTSGTVTLSGAGVGSARFTGAGGLRLNSGVSLTNNANDYTGATSLGVGSMNFSSIANLGVASSLGAPTTAANGLITLSFGGGVGTTLSYTGTGSSSDRNWQLNSASPFALANLRNLGTGTLTLTGSIGLSGGNTGFGANFTAASADMALLGVISGPGSAFYTGNAGRTITLGNANTYTDFTGISNITVLAGTLANTGSASSFGTGSSNNLIGITSGTLRYTGAGNSSNRAWSLNNGALNNDGTGALSLSGNMALANTGTLGGSYAGSDNLLSGVISGTGSLTKSGAGTWVISGANTYTGTTTVNGGTLRAGSATALGTGAAVVNSGATLDLNDFNITRSSLAGTGGIVDLGSGTLTLDAPAATNTTYAGNITGSGGLTKNGASTQVLTGANTYTGATTVNAGTLRLNFGGAGAPTSNIISSASTLNMGGGTLNATGAAGVANTQNFNGLNITAGNNTVSATSGAGGSMTINLGAINRTGGLINFGLPGSGNITTTNTVLGGWATVNGTDYAKVVGGNITAFTAADYTNKDNAATWLNNEFITDTNGFFGTVGSTVQLGGLRYTRNVATTVTVGAGQTLGVDGTIIVAPTVGTFTQTIIGGSITGMSGGGVLGVQQNSLGNFTIASQIVDNGGSIGFTKAGTGTVVLSNAASNYTGATTVSQGVLSIDNIANGGAASNIGASSAASSNLVLEGSTLRYTGLASQSSDRGFTLAKSGAILGSGIEVTNAATNLTFSGLVTSTDGANFTKTGPGTLTLSNAGNDYTGITTVNGGTLAVNALANGGLVSGIGASSNASSNLVLNGGTLSYTGATASTDRGFTVGIPGAGGTSGGIGVSDAATTLTMSGTVVGDDGLRKEGAGTLVLSGTNTYSGGTSVNAGTLRAGSTQAFGASNNSMNVLAGATLDLNGFNNAIGVLTGRGAVTLGSATLTTNGGNGSFEGSISGSGGFTRTGGGTQTMVGCNNGYTGATTISGSTLSVDCLADGGLASGIGASTSASSNLSISNGSLVYTGGNQITNRGFAVTGAGAINVNNAATTLQFGGQVIGGGFVQKDGAGTLVLSGNNIYTGGTQVNTGVLRAGSATAFGTGHYSMANTAGAAIDLNGFNLTASFLLGGGTTGGNINLGAQTLTLSTGNNTAGAAYAGNINGSGHLVKNGAQTQRLNGCNNTYTGTTTINGGSITVDCLANGGSNSGIGASSNAAGNLILNGGGLNYAGAGHSSDRLFQLGTAGGFLDASGTGALNLTNTGTIALTGTNTARTFTLTGTNTGNNTLSAQLGDNGTTGFTSLTKTGTGTWILTNNSSTYTGVTTISGGVLGVSELADGGLASGIGASSSAASNLVIGNGSTLRYTGAGDSTNRGFTLASGVSFIESSGTGAVNFTNTGLIGLSNPNVDRTVALGGTNTGNNTLAGIIGNAGTGITTLAKNGSGTWALTGNNTYTGNTVINDGNLMIGDGGTSGNLGTGNVIVNSPTSTLSMNRSDTVIFNAIMSGPGAFAQVGTGTTTLTANNSIGATLINAGTLDVNGALNTATIAMNGTSTLNVDGTVQAAGGTTAAITGGAGASTINVNGGATLRVNGDLGDGNDALTVTGTLDTGTTALNLGAGDDTLTINDGVINGAGIDAGAGIADNVVVNNALARTFGGFSGFEALTKQNTGTLTLTGSQSYSAGTTVSGGTLDVDGTLETSAISMAGGTTLNVDGTVQGMGGTAATLTGSTGAETINVNSGATLRANGDLGDGVDSLAVFGTLDTGAAALGLGAGDETVTLHDGAVISGVGIDAGTGSDQLVLDNAVALMFDGGTTAGFESLLKQNSGVTTMTGAQSFSAGTTINGGVLNVAGSLETPIVNLADNVALNVDGSLQGAGGAAATIAGSAGANTVTVGTGGNLIASGDLGGGNDVLDVAGALDTGGGTFALGDGDDTLTIHDGTNIIGAVTAGAGTDTFATDISTSADVGAVQGFETLTKTGAGALNFNGPTGSDFTTVNVLAGMLNINAAASFAGVANATVASGATLNIDGSVGFTAGADNFTVAGNVAGTGTVDLLDGDDQLTLQDGADLSGLTTAIDGGLGNDTLTADIAATAALGGAVNFETLVKSNGGTLNINGPANSQFDTVLVQGGTLYIAAGVTVDPQTTVVSSGATMTVDGTYEGTTGDDTFTVSGTVNGTGTINLLGGDDLLTLNDGADLNGLTNPLDGGAHGAGDRVVLNNANALDFDVSKTVNFEFLQKDNTGTATLTGTQSFSGGTTLNNGTLEVDGALTTPTVMLADDTTLNVDGLLQGAGGTAAAITGSAGVNTVTVNGTLTANGDLGTGNDVLDVTGTLDTAGGTFALGDGDDTLTIHDGTNILGAVTAGAGNDTFNTDIATVANLGAVQGFETLSKTGVGVLNVNGPASSDFTTVDVLAGTLNVTASGSVAAAPGSSLTTTVASGATLNVDGSYGCGDDNDTVTVSGAVSGSGTIGLCAGDDTLTLRDGADLSAFSGVLDGGDAATRDMVVLDNALAMTFDAGSLANFELLSKINAGTATLTGTLGIVSVNLDAGTLDVDGTLETSSVTMLDGTALNVDGVVRGLSGTETFLAGDDGVQTVTIGAGGSMFATGDLADGNDVLDVSGELNTNGNNFSGVLTLGSGDDLLTLHDGSVVDGVVYGGDGIDTAIVDVDLTADLGALALFEVLTKTGSGTLNINGDTVGPELFPSTVQTVNVLEGTLNVGPDGTVAAPTDGSPMSTFVASGAALNVDGSYGCGDGNDTMTVGGTVTGSGTIDLCAGDDMLTLNDGADLSGLANALNGGDGTDTVRADITGNTILGGVVNFETLTKTNVGTLNVDGPAPSLFTTVNVEGGTLDVGVAGSIAGVVTTTVDTGATLNVDGSYTGSVGNDTMTVAGIVSGVGTVNLGDGDDVLTLNDGANLSGLTNPLDGGAHGTGDAVVLNNANDLIFNAGNTINFEFLQKDNTGTATLTGTQGFSGGTTLTGGTLDVDGALETPTVALADNTTLNIDGSLQGTGGTAAAITGSTGVNTVIVSGTLTATGDLGADNDVLDVVGTLDTDGGVFALGDGDDSFIVHDGTNVIGDIDGGAGLDTHVYNINSVANLGALLNFEGVTKTGSGILNINGPDATALQEVSVLGGTLNIGPGGSVVATAGSALTTVVGSGATLNVDGSFGCGDGNDTMAVSGTVSGSGTIDLCGGEDTLTLNDGAVLNNIISGGDHGTGDTVVLNSTLAMTFDASNTINFEFLQKDSTGVATLTGAQSFTGGTTINGGTLDVDGALETPTVALGDGTTLGVDGSLQGAGGTAATITGSDGINTVTVNGTLLAIGDLGAGNDVLDVVGTLDTLGGTLALGDGDDTLTIHDGSNVLGTVAAGAGNDTLNTDIATSADLGAVQDFETLSKTGIGVLNINGPAGSEFIAVDVLAGALNVGALGGVTAQTTTVASGATLNVDGSYTGTTGNDTMTVAGTITGSGTVGLLDGDDIFTIQDGADLSGLANAVDGGAGRDTFVADLAGSATLGGAINFETLTKTNTGTLHVDGAAPSAFTTVNVAGGTLDIGVGGSVDGVVTTTVANGATFNVDGIYTGSSGSDTMTVAGTMSGNGAIDFGDGDDTLTLQDGADLSAFGGVIDGGANTLRDTVVLDNAQAMTLGAGSIANFESLIKTNTGTATLTGTQSYATNAQVLGGTLDVDGTLETSAVLLADDTTLNVDGQVQSFGGAPTTLIGSSGVNTVTVSGTLVAGGDLGAGNDVLDVAGTLDASGGLFGFDLGDGDDTFTVHDGTVVLGTVDGGAGLDTREYNINLSADLGALVNFEGVAKTGTGTLNINGPAATDLQEVSVLGGTLNVGANASVVATAGSTLATVVGSGATLNVEGSYGCGDGNDTMAVAGTVSGSGTIDLCGGDDTLTLSDGAVLNTIIDGGAHGAGDTVVLDNAGALTLDGGSTINFEYLQKDNTGTATLTGTQSFNGGTTINGGTLDVDGTLETPTVALADDTTLAIDGTLQGTGGAAATVTGSAGVNTVTVTGTLVADGDLGAGNDVLDVVGTLDTLGGTFALGDGDDRFIVHDTTVVSGTIDAGAGIDLLEVNIGAGNTAPLGALAGFESLGKSGLGTLQINGSSSFVDVEVLAGTLDVAAGGGIAAQNTTVANGATLNLDGSYTGTAGNDSLTIAGTVAGSGTMDLLGGNDTFTLRDGADLTGLATPVDGGDGTDTIVADFAGVATLGGAVNFETLTKTNTGTLNVDGPAPSAFTTVNVEGGTLNVGANGSIEGVVTTTVAADATLNVQGDFTGTAGDDSFTSRGTVSGALGFADGNDTVAFIGGDVSGLTGIDGGGGGSDSLSFAGLNIDSNNLSMTGWERVELREDSTLTLGTTLALGGGVLAIDATSQLDALAGANIGGSVENAGLINVGANRLAIAGAYSASNAALQLTVSPGSASSGGLDLTGDVTGTTAITFAGDGTEVLAPQQATSILVISSANDDLATAGDFTAANAVDGVVRVEGSVMPWTFARNADKNWYLGTEAAGLLPEVGGYAVLSSIGQAGIQDSNRLLYQRMSAMRTDTPRCGASEEQGERAYTSLAGDCHGLWVAASGSELEMGANLGFEFSGDSIGLYVGADLLLQDRGSRTFRGGLFAGFQRGNYWASGANSTDLAATGESNVQTETPAFGMYASFNWSGQTYLDMTLTAQLPTADIAVADGFREEITGNSLSLSAQMGHRFQLGNGWTVEPQLQLSASTMQWRDTVDASGKDLILDDDLLGTARAAVRAEKVFETAGGARIRPWATLGLQDTVGEKENALGVMAPGSSTATVAFPNHELGLNATIDVGIDAELNESVSVFGVLSYGESIEGTESAQRQANVGVRIRW